MKGCDCEMKISQLIVLIQIILKVTKLIGERRVSDGTQPPYFNYPYTSQVLLELKHSELPITDTCTGSIITDLIVLTAAHCLEKKSKITLFYSGFFKSRSKITYATKWIQHPQFVYNKMGSLDIGLIVASESIKLTSNVQPVLPSKWITNSQQFVGNSKSSIFCGWGIDEKKKVKGLRCITFPKFDQNCFTDEKHNIEYDWCFYTSRRSNTSSVWQNACSGDSGGGIFILSEDDHTYKQFAVVSRNTKCGKQGNTIAVQLTPKIADWIESNVNNFHGNNCSLQIL